MPIIKELRAFYLPDSAKLGKSANMITQLYQTFARTPALLPPLYQERSKRYGVERTVADYIAGMTDRYAVLEFNRVLNPAFEI